MKSSACARTATPTRNTAATTSEEKAASSAVHDSCVHFREVRILRFTSRREFPGGGTSPKKSHDSRPTGRVETRTEGTSGLFAICVLWRHPLVAAEVRASLAGKPFDVSDFRIRGENVPLDVPFPATRPVVLVDSEGRQRHPRARAARDASSVRQHGGPRRGLRERGELVPVSPVGSQGAPDVRGNPGATAPGS